MLNRLSIFLLAAWLSFGVFAREALAQPGNTYAGTLRGAVGQPLAAPVVPNSTTPPNFESIRETVNIFDVIVNATFILLSGVIFILFLYDLVKLFTTGEKQWGQKAIRAFIILFISVAVWGIVSWLSNVLNIGVGGSGVRPGIHGS